MKKYQFIILFAASIYSCNSNTKDGTKDDESLKQASKEFSSEREGNVTTTKDIKNDCDCEGEGQKIPDICSLPENYTGKYYACFKDTCIVQIQGFLLNGKRHTEFDEIETWYHKNGKVSCKGHFYKGKEAKDWIWYFPSGSVHMTGKYVDGNKSGVWETFYENGQIGERQEYGFDYIGSTPVSGNPIGKRESWYENGQPEFIGNPRGRFVKYFDNGQIEIEGGTWGEYSEYYKNGQIKVHGKKLPGDIRDSTWDYYDEKGYKIKIAKYSKGKLL